MQMPLVLTNRRRRGGGASAFSPSSLYSSGSQGIWLDPSDLSTMFSDRAGTTAVTAPGTVVGLRLDKSKGLTLGAEIVANGTFDGNSTTGWTGSNATLSSTSSALIVTPTTTNALAYTAVNLVVGKSYVIKADIVAVNGSTQTKRLQVGTSITGGQMLQYIVPSTPQSLQAIFVATATVGYVNVYTFDGTNATVWDNISVRELAGNHATAPTDAARPIYGVEPKGGRRNLLTYSEQFDNAAWTKTNATIAPNAAAAPDGTMTAEKIIATNASGNHFAGQTVTMGAAAHTISVYMKAAEYTTGSIFITQSGNNGAVFTLSGSGSSVASGTGNTASIVSVGNDWYRCSVTNNGSADIFDAIRIGPADGATAIYTGDNTSGILIWGAQLELGSTATAYQRTTTAYDITESGVATCHYVQYDGSDDSMSTAAIDFTGTDKMSVFAGVRKLSDADSRIVELSVDPTSNAGAFWLSGPQNTYEAFSRGTAAIAANQLAIATGFVSPTINVVTSTHDIAGDLTTIRVNGAASASATGDKGTGNFGNYPLFIGRRNNASLPFNGRDYGIIVVGKAASAGEITDTETWLAAKTAQVTL